MAARNTDKAPLRHLAIQVSLTCGTTASRFAVQRRVILDSSGTTSYFAWAVPQSWIDDCGAPLRVTVIDVAPRDAHAVFRAAGAQGVVFNGASAAAMNPFADHGDAQ